ncbi:MAG: hypothetical protein OXC64_06820 [Flavobacteriaceae bacterium]|nr:hypothetical protein [Flavobacteriaceae bacterium]
MSRFDDHSTFDLGKLDKQSEIQVIKDWVQKEGNIKKSISCDLWVNEIMKHTHGWAQHINVYGRAASEYLENNVKHFNQKSLLKEGLNEVLNEGKRKRFRYYEERLDTFKYEEIVEITKILNENNKNLAMKSTNIISSFNKEAILENPEDLFERSVERRIFHRVEDRRYIVPIPSMYHWLVSDSWKVKVEDLI